MIQYILKGVVMPERALLSITGSRSVELIHSGTGRTISVDLSIVLNQITVWVQSEFPWDLHDLRNIVLYHVNNVCACMAFAKGLAYEVDIRQVLNKEQGIDYVYGIEVPCIAERRKTEEEVTDLFNDVLRKRIGKQGIYINRCVNDLKMALSHSEDTAFYCFRAIESLRFYCEHAYAIAKESEQWQKVASLSGYDRGYIEQIARWAGTERHGGAQYYSGDQRAEMLTKTWNVVEGFITNL